MTIQKKIKNSCIVEKPNSMFNEFSFIDNDYFIEDYTINLQHSDIKDLRNNSFLGHDFEYVFKENNDNISISDDNNQNKIGPKVSINYNEPDLDNYFTPEKININFNNYEEKESIDINLKQNNFFQTENNISKKLPSSIIVSQNDKNKKIKDFIAAAQQKR